MTEALANPRRRRRADSLRLSAELAALATVAVHAALLYGFRLRPSLPPPPPLEPEPPCILVGPWRDSDAWEQQLYGWLEVADPTLFSLPDEEHGFVSIRHGERQVPLTPVPAFEIRFTLAPELAYPAAPWPLPPWNLARELSRSWPAASPAAPATPPTATLPEGILWRRPDGTVLKDMPAIAEAEWKRALAGGPPPAGPTVMVASGDPVPGRVRLERGSGNPRLDDLGLRKLRERLARGRQGNGAPADNAAPPAAASAPAAATDSQTIEIEWRLVREPDNKPEGP